MKFLFELGLEELPSRYVDVSEKALKENIQKRLVENRIKFTDIKTYSSPRRLAIIINGLNEKSESLSIKKIGPSYDLAIKNGEKTKILLGFLKSNNATEDDYTVIDTEKGKYIQIEKVIKAEKTSDLLVKILDESIRALEFEKAMKWGTSQFRFVRPIKWILCMLDNEILDFEFENIKSADITRGLRAFGSQNIKIVNIDDYEKILLENYVVVDRELREKMIIDSINNNLKDADKYVQIDKDLLKEVVNLVEYPYAIIGEFDKKYLKLPEELITITMKTHQRYFPVRFKDNSLANNFVVIRNAPEYSEYVKRGNEKVIEPRLADSKFFFDEDLKTDLEGNVEKLKQITFQKDMGTIYEKVERATKIAKFLNANEDTLRAIKLSKADLVSNVINEKEFTSLQGMMGSIYAKHQGEKEIVALAIKEHYLPRFQNDTLPTSMEGAIASICDKLDTAVGAFCVGLKPTSSKDPYAIRRAVQGICQVAISKKLDIDYNILIEKAYEIFKDSKEVKYEKALEEFKEYMKQRLENVLAEKYGKSLVSYIIDINTNFKIMIEKLEKLKTIESTEKFNSLINILKRIKNIVKDSKDSQINENLLEDMYEKEMFKLIAELKNKDFSKTIDILLDFEKTINDFFDNVKINVDNENIKNNRIAILKEILNILGDVISV